MLASWFGTGYLPDVLWGGRGAAGTISGLTVLALALAIGRRGVLIELGIALIILVVGLWVVAPFATDFSDPNWVTIDEAAGTMLAVLGLSGWPALAAFVVFRLADISKIPPGVRAAQDLHGAPGVMLDDVVAGLWGLAAGWAVHYLLNG